MAKQLQFNVGGVSWSGGIVKVDRDKVYGYIEEIVTDSKGEPCVLASILDDGRTLILGGQTAMKTVDLNFAEVDKKSLKTVNLDGTEATLVPSSFDAQIEPKPITLDDLYNLEVMAVYQMTFEQPSDKKSAIDVLSSITGLGLSFNYRADYEASDAILLLSQGEVFLLTGRLLAFDYLKNEPAVIVEDEADTEEEVDFGML